MFRACGESNYALAVLLLALTQAWVSFRNPPTHPALPYARLCQDRRQFLCTFVGRLQTGSPDQIGLRTVGLRTLGRGHACHAPPKHCIYPQGHALSCLFTFRGGSMCLLLQAHPGSSATFSNPGKKNCGRFGRALFF